MVAQSRIASAAFSQAVTIDEISSFIYDGQMGLKGYVDSCVQVFLKVPIVLLYYFKNKIKFYWQKNFVFFL